MTLGFIGTGTIAAALVEGLRRASHDEPIVLSPRSEATSRALAARLADVRRAEDNAEVATADTVFIAVRPAEVETALAGITFRPGQTVVSLVANLALAELAALAPQATVARVLPLPAVARGRGPLLALPRLPLLERLLAGLGEVIFPADEAAFAALLPVSAMMSSYFELQQRLSQFAMARGVEGEVASLYVRALFDALADTAMRAPAEHLADLPGEHETRGGLNERVRRALMEAAWFERPQTVLAGLGALARTSLE